MIERARASRTARPLFPFPLLVALWANVHVECVFGIGLVGLFGLIEWVRPAALPRREAARIIGIATMALLCTAINPYGAGVLRYLYENAFVPQVISIAELQPPYLPNYRGFFAWAILGGALVVIRWRTATLAEVATIVVFGLLGFRYLRLTPLPFLASAPLVARCIDGLEAFGVTRRAAAATACVAVAVMARVPVLDLARSLHLKNDALMPQTFFSEPAMAFARERGLAGPVFTSMNLGSFVAWELYPDARIFQDSRLQAYPASHFRAIIDASRSPDAWAGLTRSVDWAVLSLPRVNELSGVGRFDPAAWGTAYRDRAIEIVVRRNGAYGALVDGALTR